MSKNNHIIIFFFLIIKNILNACKNMIFILFFKLMSQLSPEVIIDDFSKLKEIFNNQEEEIIWKIFSEKLFNFNHTL